MLPAASTAPVVPRQLQPSPSPWRPEPEDDGNSSLAYIFFGVLGALFLATCAWCLVDECRKKRAEKALQQRQLEARARAQREEQEAIERHRAEEEERNRPRPPSPLFSPHPGLLTPGLQADGTASALEAAGLAAATAAGTRVVTSLALPRSDTTPVLVVPRGSTEGPSSAAAGSSIGQEPASLDPLRAVPSTGATRVQLRRQLGLGSRGIGGDSKNQEDAEGRGLDSTLPSGYIVRIAADPSASFSLEQSVERQQALLMAGAADEEDVQPPAPPAAAADAGKAQGGASHATAPAPGASRDHVDGNVLSSLVAGYGHLRRGLLGGGGANRRRSTEGKSGPEAHVAVSVAAAAPRRASRAASGDDDDDDDNHAASGADGSRRAPIEPLESVHPLRESDVTPTPPPSSSHGSTTAGASAQVSTAAAPAVSPAAAPTAPIPARTAPTSTRAVAAAADDDEDDPGRYQSVLNLRPLLTGGSSAAATGASAVGAGAGIAGRRASVPRGVLSPVAEEEGTPASTGAGAMPSVSSAATTINSSGSRELSEAQLKALAEAATAARAEKERLANL